MEQATSPGEVVSEQVCVEEVACQALSLVTNRIMFILDSLAITVRRRAGVSLLHLNRFPGAGSYTGREDGRFILLFFFF
jgi:hypothetical protein